MRKQAIATLLLGSLLPLSACPKTATTDYQKPDGGCIVGGCSGQLCTEASEGPVASTCEFRAAYACYGQHSTCERQPSGQCGWTPTPALDRCLKQAD